MTGPLFCQTSVVVPRREANCEVNYIATGVVSRLLAAAAWLGSTSATRCSRSSTAWSTSTSTAAWCTSCVAGWHWAANGDRNLLANHLWYASRNGVRNLTADRSRHLDGLGRAYRLANGVRNLLATLLAGVAASAVVAYLRAAFFTHVAYTVGACLRAAFLVHVAYTVGACLLRWNHAADAVVAYLRAALRNHLARTVVASLRALLANVAANTVVAIFGTALTSHMANAVGAYLGAAFWNHTADSVRNRLADRLANVACAVDRLLFASWNPDFLAARLRWCLAANSLRATWLVDVSASCRIIRPRTLALNCSAVGSTRNGVRLGRPVSTFDVYRLGVRNCLTNVATNGSILGFGDRLVNRVVNRTSACLVGWHVHSVVDRALLGFVMRNVHCVATSLRLVVRHVYRVIHCSSLGLVVRYVDGVVDRALVRLVDRLTNCVIHSLVMCLSHVVRHVDRLRVVNCFPHSAVSSELLRFHNGFANCSHHRRCSSAHRVAAGITDHGSPHRTRANR